MRYAINISHGKDKTGRSSNFYHLDGEESILSTFLYGSYEGWMNGEDFLAYIKGMKKKYPGLNHVISDRLQRMMSGEDVLPEIIPYYVGQFRELLDFYEVPLIPFEDLHEYVDINVVLDEACGNPFSNISLEDTISILNLVSERYNRTLQG